MTQDLLTGIIGVVGGAIVAWISLRRYPSRITTDAINLVDAFGKVRSNLTEEIDRLEARLDEATAMADRCQRRVKHLEAILRDHGIDPDGV
jgi:hypothetical protein